MAQSRHPKHEAWRRQNCPLQEKRVPLQNRMKATSSHKTMIPKATRQLLKDYADRYETASFINGDPSWFMHQVHGAENQEAMAFWENQGFRLTGMEMDNGEYVSVEMERDI